MFLAEIDGFFSSIGTQKNCSVGGRVCDRVGDRVGGREGERVGDRVSDRVGVWAD